MQFFHENSPINRFLSRVFELALLNVLTLLCSIPILTAGAALTAMHYVLFHMVQGDEAHLIRSFFKSFRLNFRQATGIWAIELAVIGITLGEIRLLGLFSPDGPSHPVQWLILVPSLFFFLVFRYPLPYLSRFENSIREIILNSVSIALLHFPQTFAQAAILAGFGAFCFFILPMPFWPLLAFFGVSFPAWLCARIYTPLLSSLCPGKSAEDSREDPKTD